MSQSLVIGIMGHRIKNVLYLRKNCFYYVDMRLYFYCYSDGDLMAGPNILVFLCLSNFLHATQSCLKVIIAT